MQVTERRCDRCEEKLGASGRRLGITVTVNYHHPKTLDFCDVCEGSFALWLGKHPLWGTRVSEMDNHFGEGYPSSEQLTQYRIGKL